jgi:hypothetical protein
MKKTFDVEPAISSPRNSLAEQASVTVPPDMTALPADGEAEVAFESRPVVAGADGQGVAGLPK